MRVEIKARETNILGNIAIGYVNNHVQKLCIDLDLIPNGCPCISKTC